MFCRKCGEIIDDEAVICPKCGVSQQVNEVLPVNDEGGIGWCLLGLCVPVAGLVIYLLWNKERPNTAASVKKGLIGYLIYLVIAVLFYIVVLVLSIGIGTSTYENRPSYDSDYNYEDYEDNDFEDYNYEYDEDYY